MSIRPWVAALALLLVFGAGVSADEGEPGPKRLKVLFVGNSYTWRLPESIAKLAKSGKRLLIFKAIHPGGCKLKNHCEDGAVFKALKQKRWQRVVFQEQSQIPSFPAAQRRIDMDPFALRLCDAARERGARPLLFLTWGRRDGDTRNFPKDDFTAMQKRLEAGIEAVARKSGAEVVPVGRAWAEAIGAGWGQSLYAADGSHPSAAGLYLNAAMFYAHLFGASPVGLKERGGLKRTEAKRIQALAARVALAAPEPREPESRPERPAK